MQGPGGPLPTPLPAGDAGFGVCTSLDWRYFQLLEEWAWENVKGLGRLWLCFILSSSLSSSLWPVRGMREERVFYDYASFYYQQEGSFCNLCMKFMSFPGERRGLTGEGGGHAGGAGPGFLPLGRGEVWRGGTTQLT
ncbi:unnamed protein product [Pipistrellus nathusii]|uniref:Uncharacterized protein n=1 Tax=Pipistrellus nathusii TaxID=59473 RepID=A0ABP0A6U7_PIPNA